MITGQQVSPAMQSFYTATLRVVLLILKDYKDFLCDFHFNFVNALPDHAIQLRNMILAAYPSSIELPYPFLKDLKFDKLKDMKEPRILSNYETYLSISNLKGDLSNYFKSKKQSLITEICDKMMAAKERVNGREIPRSTVINAVVLAIAAQSCAERKQGPETAKKENLEMCKQIVLKLNKETRLCFLNCIVNELRFPNSHTFNFCLILLYLFIETKSVEI